MKSVAVETAKDLAAPSFHCGEAVRSPTIRADLGACALLTFIWISPGLWIGLHGDFPINDDWAYARSVKAYVEAGSFSRPDWVWVPLITHTILGWISSLFVGFSFEALRLVGFVSGWLGVLGTYVLLRQSGLRPMISGYGSAILALNPLYLNLSYTFMTDVPFTAFLVWSVICIVHGIKTGKYWGHLLGFALAIAATLSRQFGVVVPAACAFALVLTRPQRWTRWCIASFIVALTAAIYLVVPLLIYKDRRNIAGDLHILNYALRQNTELYHILCYGTRHFMYLGLILAPLTAYLTLQRVIVSRSLILPASVLSIIVLSGVIWQQWRLPGINIINEHGVGPMEVLRQHEQLPRAGPLFWWPITVIAIASASSLTVYLLIRLWRQQSIWKRDSVFLVIVASASIYFLIILTRHLDRYLIPLIPLATVILLYPLANSSTDSLMRLLPGIGVLLLMAAFSILGTRDYMVRNRARWDLLNSLVERGVTADRIDGGFEFNGWNNYADPRADRTRWTRRWVIDDEFVVSPAASLPGYRLEDTRTYRRTLWPGMERVRLFRRVSCGIGSKGDTTID